MLLRTWMFTSSFPTASLPSLSTFSRSTRTYAFSRVPSAARTSSRRAMPDLMRCCVIPRLACVSVHQRAYLGAGGTHRACMWAWPCFLFAGS